MCLVVMNISPLHIFWKRSWLEIHHQNNSQDALAAKGMNELKRVSKYE